MATHKTPAHDPRGAAASAATSNDPNAPKQTELELRRSKERLDQQARVFDTALSSSPDFHYIFDRDHRFTYVNRTLLKLWGLTLEQAVGRNFKELGYPPELVTLHEGQLNQVLETRKAVRGENAYTGPDGKTGHYEYIFLPIFDEKGEVQAISGTTRDITERKAVEHARLEEQRRAFLLEQIRQNQAIVENERENFRNLFMQTPEMVCILRGPEHVFEFANEAHIKTLGFDATGMPVRQAQPESVEVHGILDRVFQTGVTAELHEIPVTVTDRLRYFNLTYAARRGLDGAIDGVMILGTEVTGDVLTRQELQRSQKRLKDLADSISHIVWVTNKDGEIEYYNRRWFDYTGFTAEQSKDLHIWRQTIHPEDFARISPAWHDSLKQGTIFEAEWRMKGRDGIYRWHLVRTLPAYNERGEINAWYGTSTDVDAQKRLRERSKFFADIAVLFSESLEVERTLQSLADIVVKNLADWCSIALVEENGPPREAAVAHPDPGAITTARELFKDYPTDWSAKTGAPQVIRTGRAELYRDIPEALLRQAAKDDRHFGLLKELGFRSAMVVPLVARGKVLGAISFISSGSGRHYNEKDLELAEELGRRAGMAVDAAMLFEQAQKAVRARDEFLSIASHELKTPLTSLKLQAQIRAREVDRGDLRRFSPDKLAKLIADDERQVNRLTRLVDDMLDISRIQSGKLSLTSEEFDLNDMIEESLARFSAQIEITGSKVAFTPCRPARGRWDRFRIEQAFVNLLTNALKYGGGNPIQVNVVTAPGSAELRIADHGLGIRREDQARIFGQFERAVSSKSISGLGLGLYISRMIVEAHQGRISVSSEEGQGSTFTIELPLEAGV